MTTDTPRPAGRLDQRIEAALHRAVELGEVGLQVAAYLGDELIVDAWIGEQDGPGSRPVDGSTVFPVFSVSKAITATAVHLQAERGLIDYDAPLARYWPEYGTRGKDAITVRHVLTHRAGVSQMPPEVTPELICDWQWMVDQLVQVEPLHPPGSRNTYLSMTFGWLLGEVVRRTDPLGRSFGAFVQEEICGPLGMDSYWFGIPAEVEPRVATLTFPGQPPPPSDGSPVRLAVPPQVTLAPAVFNRRDVQRACIPAVGGIANARSLARLFAMLANGGELDGVRLLSEERVLACLAPRPDFEQVDEVYGNQMPVGMGGYWLTAGGVRTSGAPHPRILCHIGAGSSLGWADLDTKLSVAICHNRMFGALPEHPYAALTEAIWEIAIERSAPVRA